MAYLNGEELHISNTWTSKMRDKKWSVDLVVPQELLFVKSLEELRQLDLTMLQQLTTECGGWALKALGPAYELAWHEQRKIIAELLAFESSHPKFATLAMPCSKRRCARGFVVLTGDEPS